MLIFRPVGTKILFADDDALVSRIYRDKLVEEGFDVIVAEDGVVTLRRMLEFRPDVVVLDLLMPKMNGGEVLKFIRQHPELKSTRVIVFSNSFLSALVEQVGAAGVQETLPKSCATPARLIEVVRKVAAGPAAGAAPSGGGRISIASDFTPATANDEQFNTRVQSEFAQNLPGVVAEIRKECGQLLAAQDAASELAAVEELSRKVGFLTQMSSMAGNQPLAQLASALELLVYHLSEKGGAVSDSARDTIATTTAFLTAEMENLGATGVEEPPPVTVLLVDDDEVTNRAIIHALSHANFHAVGETDPKKALEYLRQNACDVVLLDIEMPGMDGLELCEHIRTLDNHRRTPVIFITGHGEAKTRAWATLSGGNEFICKPILPIELTVKVITSVLRERFARQKRQG